MNLLIIEDDEIVAKTIERSLRGNNFQIKIANNGMEGLKMVHRQQPDLVILDIIMPGLDGYTVCKELRSDPETADIPILFLTAKVKDEDRIAGFLAGADDYLTKPFNIDELELRIRAILRRVHNQKFSSNKVAGNLDPSRNSKRISAEPEEKDNNAFVNVRGFSLNLITYELEIPSHGKIRLTPVQFDLLFHLMTHPDEIFPPARLLDEVWNYPADTGSHDLVRVHIKNLRERIENNPKNPQFIQTIAGYGYTVRKTDQLK